MKDRDINVRLYVVTERGDRTHLRHEGLNRTEDLWVSDQLRIHVGVVVHHLPEDKQ